MTIVDGHPDPNRAHLNHALADRYAAAAQAAGSEVRRVNVAELDFPLLRVPDEFWHGSPPESIQRAQHDIQWADHLAFFYPLWHSDMPAVLKGFVEQAFRPGFAIAEDAGRMRFPKRLFAGKSARIVVTMGMPPIVYRALFHAHTVKAFRAILRLSGVAPVHVTLFGSIMPSSSDDHACWMTRIDALARRDGRPREHRPRTAVSVVGKAAMVAAGVYGAYRFATRPRGADHAPAEPSGSAAGAATNRNHEFDSEVVGTPAL